MVKESVNFDLGIWLYFLTNFTENLVYVLLRSQKKAWSLKRLKKTLSNPKLTLEKEDRLKFFPDLKLWPLAVLLSLSHKDAQYLILKSSQILNGILVSSQEGSRSFKVCYLPQSTPIYDIPYLLTMPFFLIISESCQVHASIQKNKPW